MIPSTFHYCFGMSPDFGGIGYSYVHYLSVLLAKRVAGAERIRLHFTHEPTGPWWERTLALVEANHIESPTEVFGNPINHPAHRADLVRLRALHEEGGVYLDMDVWPLRPFTSFAHCECVLGLQDGSYGLCNAVILATPGAEFIGRWLDQYRDFDGSKWDEHSVRRPILLAAEHPHLVHIQPDTAFFWPHLTDPHAVFFDCEKAFRERRLRELRSRQGHFVMRNWEIIRTRTGRAGAAMLEQRQANLTKLRSSFAIHLWESVWRDPYLEQVSPTWLKTSECVLATRVREALGSEGVAEATEGAP